MVFAGVGGIKDRSKRLSRSNRSKRLATIELFERIEPLERMLVGGLHGDKTF
jgi:hypothetical protein